MIYRLYAYLLNRPSLLRGTARVLWNLGCFGLLAGVLAAALTSILAVVTSFGGSGEASYQQLFPGLPTWWVPESPGGVAFCLAAMLVGYLLQDLSREVERLQRG
jgi:hypothetical protein